MDYLKGGRGFGGVAAQLIANGMDTDALRPFVHTDGNSYVNQKMPNGLYQAVPTANQGIFRHEEWRTIDRTVIEVAKPRLQAVGDLRSRGLTHSIDGMSTIIMSYETESDITGATISMDGMRESDMDRPVYDIANLPIPIIHKDCKFSARQIAESRRSGRPLDTTTIAKATRRCAEEAEKLLIGTAGSYYYGGGTVYGYTNFPGRLTKTLTLPTAAGWTPNTLMMEFLAMKQLLINDFHRGPYIVYTSSDWEQYLDDDYSSAYNGNTLRSRLLQINNISSIQTLDYLNGFQMIMLEPSSDVVQMVVGMEMRVLQWESAGGMEVNMKVMCILVPWFHQDQNSNSGILHALAA